MSWVLLRGLTREARHWGGFATQLAAQLSPSSVTALDLPGNGEFCQQPSATSVSAIAEFARQKLLAQGIKPPYQLLAMSLGGMVATDWAQRYPLEVDRLVLINTSMRPFSSMTERLRPGNWPELALLAARWSDGDYVESTIHRLTCNNTTVRDADLAAWRQIRRSAPVKSGNVLRQLTAAARFACAAQTPRCSTLVLSSHADQLVDPLCSTQLAAAWQVAHRIHPWAGHDLPHDDGPWICQQVAEWLKG